MKTHNIIMVLALLMILATGFNTSSAQDSTGRAAMQTKISGKDFVFVPQTVLPQRGITRQLTSYYFLRVLKDTLTSELPYFGRAYTAPINPSEGGIRFSSTAFDFTSKDRKRGGWDIMIKPKDVNDVQQLLLTVFENGRASLQVISNSRQAINFDGQIRENKK